jgi:transcriptional regulator with XRE-family HTH domain
MTGRPANSDIEKAVGLKIASLRVKRGWTQGFVGERLGVSFQQMYKLESGINKLSISQLVKAAEVFGVSVNYLLDTPVGELPIPERGRTIQGLISRFLNMPKPRQDCLLDIARALEMS